MSVDMCNFEKSEVDAVISEMCTFGFKKHDVQTKNQGLKNQQNNITEVRARPDGVKVYHPTGFKSCIPHDSQVLFAQISFTSY